MKFKVTRVSSPPDKDEVEIDSLEGLLEFVLSQEPHPVIVNPPYKNTKTGEQSDWDLEVYDGYRE